MFIDISIMTENDAYPSTLLNSYASSIPTCEYFSLESKLERALEKRYFQRLLKWSVRCLKGLRKHFYGDVKIFSLLIKVIWKWKEVGKENVFFFNWNWHFFCGLRLVIASFINGSTVKRSRDGRDDPWRWHFSNFFYTQDVFYDFQRSLIDGLPITGSSKS